MQHAGGRYKTTTHNAAKARTRVPTRSFITFASPFLVLARERLQRFTILTRALANADERPNFRSYVAYLACIIRPDSETRYIVGNARRRGCDTQNRRKQSFVCDNDPQPGVVQELYPWTAMCVRNVDVHVSCSSHVDAQLAAFFIDPRAK